MISTLFERLRVRAHKADKGDNAPNEASRAERAAAAASALRNVAHDLQTQEAAIAAREHERKLTASRLRDEGNNTSAIFHLQLASQDGARLATVRSHLLGVERALHQIESCASTRAVCDELERCSRALQAVAPDEDAVDDVLAMMDASETEVPDMLTACAAPTVDGQDWEEALRLLPAKNTGGGGADGASGAAGAVRAWPSPPNHALPATRASLPRQAARATHTNVVAAGSGSAGSVLRRLDRPRKPSTQYI